MRLLRDGSGLRRARRGTAVAVGSFDGLHLGHQAVVARARGAARRLDTVVTVVLFEPLPREFFEGGGTRRLYGLRQRIVQLQAMDVDQAVCIRFDARRAAQPAAAFVREVLADALAAQVVVVGQDFRFGHRRAGDVELLRDIGRRRGFAVESLPEVMHQGRRISSTWVREALAAGDFAAAERLLGRPYRLSGRVGHGEKQAGRLGFPTANLLYGRNPPPLQGVYAGQLEGAGAGARRCVINAGRRPMFSGDDYRLEVHVPRFAGRLYGRRLEVRPLFKIRDEQRFESLDALRRAIGSDVEASLRCG